MVGQNIGKYRVLDRVGRGGMGTVYRAIDETLHREVAIKVLNAELNDPEVAKRFRAEAITVARLSHPGIATIYELFQHEGQWLMVMEFVRGETLERMAERLGALPPERAAELCMQSLSALAHAHSMGVVHRDLKPANIMVTESGAVKIMDFGIARVAGTEHLTNAGFMMGTPAYMAPEQVLGHEIDARADIYAMGVVFYRLLTGQLPFRGETPFAMAQAQVNNPPTPARTIRADLPPWVDDVMARSLAKKPDDRFPSAVAFHEGFARCLAGLPISADYSSSAPTGLISTPPRAMPTGSIERSSAPGIEPGAVAPAITSGASASMPIAVPVDLSAAAPTMAGTPVSTLRPPTETILATDLHATPAPVAAGGTAAIRPADASAPPAAKTKTSGGLGIAGIAAAAIVVIGVAAGVWVHRHRASSAPPVEPAPAVEPAPVPTPAGADAAAAAPTVTPIVAPEPAPAPARPAPAAPPASPASAADAALPEARGTAADSSAADTGRRGAAPAVRPAGKAAVDDTLVSFADIKVLEVTGKKTKDDDVLVSLGAGQISVARKRDSSPVAAWPYKNVTHATYVKARDPQWDSSLASPPDDLDVGGMLRTSKHWLVLQNKDTYLILRLSDSNVERLIEVVAARTGITVSRPNADADKN